MITNSLCTFRLFLYFKQIECYIGHIYKRARIYTTQYISYEFFYSINNFHSLIKLHAFLD